jgi:antitoxin component YwqK of YwqJK toxin-antitoxin module
MFSQYKVEQCDTFLNQLDAQGQKQGCWAKYHPNKTIRYKAYFVDGQPTGKVIRYYENGEKMVEMIFTEQKNKVKATHYFRNGNIAAKGNYINKQRDSIWNFYSYYEQNLIVQEQYDHGTKIGKTKRFYDSGNLSEVVEWNEGTKDGEWNQYYDNGNLRLEAHYEDGIVHGDFNAYHYNGNIHIDGYYKNDLKHGEWKFYSKERKLKYTIVYENGEALNEEVLEEREEEFFKKVEENKGKYSEPSINDMSTPPESR